MAQTNQTKDPLDVFVNIFVGTITKDGVIEHPEPADPRMNVMLVAEITPVRFFRGAKYLPSVDHQRDFIDTMYRWTADTIYLVSDGSTSDDSDDNIYCIAYGPPFEIPMLFGKLVEECEIYQLCARAFATFTERS